MDNTSINYVIHIATTPEKLWEALTNPEALKRNWGIIHSQWTAGSPVTEVSDAGGVLWKGEVLQSDPPRLLVFTFDVIGSGEPATTVRFELTPQKSSVRLMVTQVEFQSNSDLFAGCAHAWPEIMSSFKTYIETGRPIRFDWKP